MCVKHFLNCAPFVALFFIVVSEESAYVFGVFFWRLCGCGCENFNIFFLSFFSKFLRFGKFFKRLWDDDASILYFYL